MVVLISDEKIYIANAGDSSAWLYTKDGLAKPLTKEHKPDDELEKKRILNAGGWVSEGRVNDNLNLSRAIGDLEYKKNSSLSPSEQIITALPDIKVVNRNNQQNFLLMGCDGI